MDILTGLKIVRDNLDKLTVTGVDSAGRLSGCWEMVNKIISAVETAHDEASKSNVTEEQNG